MIKRNSFKTLLAVGTGIGLTASAASAATIAWNFSEIVNTPNPGLQDTTGTGFLTTAGTFIYAENTGGGATSLDGIAFGAGTITFAGTGSGTAAVFHNNSTTAPITNTAAFGGVGSGAQSVTLGNGGVGGALQIGATYSVQLIVMDGRGAFAGRTFEVDGNATDHTLGTSGVTWGNALLATGTFVADADSQAFTLEVLDGGTSQGAHLNALVLHQTAAAPEPSSTALLGLGGLALILRRKK